MVNKTSYILVVTITCFLASTLFMNCFLVVPEALAGEGFYRSPSSREIKEEQMRSRFNLIKAVQHKLNVKGYDAGPVDGFMGPKTEDALTAFQKENGLISDGTIRRQTLKALGLVQ
ncbi:hypothetical protein MNBD_DELTA01-215 [hydrothermal vent metagenome]|uniref:Peptidoglycan binding-like domain-containing protein n=1 Tax=hydrothermal vent metagenome TaxID=652676 RepID=A0A3B0QUP1_9ZZZZ